jgi:formate dehydrogenase major subunit
MDISRRGFLKLSGGAVAAGAVGSGIVAPDEAQAKELPIRDAKKTTTICPYCAVGCGIVVHTKDGKVVNTEGDPDHPINEGTLCSKGAALYQVVNTPARLTKPRYRAPGSNEWKEVEWDWALDEIAKKIKESRDETFVVKNRKGQVVNRCDGLASVGSAALDNEECYIFQKWLRSLGLVYIEHQARI